MAGVRPRGRWTAGSTLEDPTRLEPAEREVYVEACSTPGCCCAASIDRVDIAPDGAIRVVDYKSGLSPARGLRGRALFQMKFYALVLWRTRGVVPTMLQLVYLGRRRDPALRARRGGPAGHRAQGARPSGRRSAHAEQTGDWQPSPRPAVRLVRAPGALPGVRRHSPAAADRAPCDAPAWWTAGPPVAEASTRVSEASRDQAALGSSSGRGTRSVFRRARRLVRRCSPAVAAGPRRQPEAVAEDPPLAGEHRDVVLAPRAPCSRPPRPTRRRCWSPRSPGSRRGRRRAAAAAVR